MIIPHRGGRAGGSLLPLSEKLAPRKRTGLEFIYGAGESAAEVIVGSGVTTWKPRAAVAQDGDDLWRGGATAQQFFSDPFISDAPVRLWEAFKNPQSVQPSSIAAGRAGGWFAARQTVCIDGIVGHVRRNRARRQRQVGRTSHTAFGLLQQSATPRGQASVGVQHLQPRRIAASVASLWFFIGEPSQTAQVTPIGAGQVAAIGESQILADEAGDGRLDGSGADSHPGLQIAGAGLEYHTRFVPGTSTYVEGAAEKNPMIRRGYSRDHRPDCEQLVIALIVNNEGFPFSYETFDGNRTDVSTMETILRMVERKYGKARRIWVFDRGIVSEENLAAIRKRDGQYLTGTPRSQMKQFEAELLKEDWTQVRPEVEVKKVAIPQGEETYILCRTSGRKEKEKAIRNRFSNSMETALKGLEKAIATGRLKDRNKMERRLGKIQARHPQVNDLYDVALKDTAEGVRLFWQIKEDRKNWRESREGAYLLRTNLQAETAEELWSKYMQLTEAEASFRALKSELSIRPLFHQLEPRVKAHVMVAFLGYALWVTLKHLLKRRPAIVPKPSASGVENAQPMTPMKAIALLSTLQSADIVLPTTDGREIRLRRITEPTAEQKSLLRQLGISLPEHLQFHRECSADSAIA